MSKTNRPRWWSLPDPPLEHEERLDAERKARARKKQPKRVKGWVQVYPHGQTVLNDVRPAVALHAKRVARLIEARPGDVVLSREDAEKLRSIVEAYWMVSGQTTAARDRALALLRGRR